MSSLFRSAWATAQRDGDLSHVLDLTLAAVTP